MTGKSAGVREKSVQVCRIESNMFVLWDEREWENLHFIDIHLKMMDIFHACKVEIFPTLLPPLFPEDESKGGREGSKKEEKGEGRIREVEVLTFC